MLVISVIIRSFSDRAFPASYISALLAAVNTLARIFPTVSGPEALPLLYKIVCLLRPYRINLHARAYEAIFSMQE